MQSWQCFCNGIFVVVSVSAYRIALFSSLIMRVSESYKNKVYAPSRWGLTVFMLSLFSLSSVNVSAVMIVDGHMREDDAGHHRCEYTAVNAVLGITTDVLMGMAIIYYFTRPLAKLMEYGKVAKHLIVRQSVLICILIVYSIVPYFVGVLQDAFLDERMVTPYVMGASHMTLSMFCLMCMFPASLVAGNRAITCCCFCGCVDSDIEQIMELHHAACAGAAQQDEEEEKREATMSMPDSDGTETQNYKNRMAALDHNLRGCGMNLPDLEDCE